MARMMATAQPLLLTALVLHFMDTPNLYVMGFHRLWSPPPLPIASPVVEMAPHSSLPDGAPCPFPLQLLRLRSNSYDRTKNKKGDIVLRAKSPLFASSSLNENGNSAPTSTTGWKDRVLQWSTLASMLCIVDCTFLPILTVVVPLLGLTTATIMPWLPALSHQIAVYFVVPVGSLATTLNAKYNTSVDHQKRTLLACMGYIGVLLVLLANAGSIGGGTCAHHHGVHKASVVATAPLSLSSLQGLRHALHHGVLHRVVNLTGCALLITSNLVSRGQKHNHEHHGATCTNPNHKH